jgi:hypothetical protein
MSRFQQGSLLKMKRKSAPDVWVFRWYSYKGGKRRYMKRTVGTVVEFPQRRDAEKALLSFRYTINSPGRSTGEGLRPHYPLPTA